MQGPEGVAAADFARQNGREEVQFILGDYPADVRQAIIDGYILGTINQDPYPQAYEGDAHGFALPQRPGGRDPEAEFPGAADHHHRQRRIDTTSLGMLARRH